MLKREIVGRSDLLLIEYVDGAGASSSREVLPLSLEGEDTSPTRFEPSYLEAFCHLRNDHRTFRLDRIRSIGSATTGEMLDLPTWLNSLRLGPPVQIDEQHTEEFDEQPVIRGWGWRWLIGALLVGYALGRWRMVSRILTEFGFSWGKWL